MTIQMMSSNTHETDQALPGDSRADIRDDLLQSKQAENRTKLSENALSELEALQPGVSITCWIRLDDGQVVPYLQRETVGPELSSKIMRLAEKVAEEEQIAARIIASDDRFFLVAAPLPNQPGHVLTVLFPIEKDRDRQQRFELRKQKVELAAAYLALDMSFASRTGESSKSESHDSQETQTQKTKHLFDYLKSVIQACIQRPWIAAAGLASILLIAFVPWPYHVVCEVQCEPASQRFVAAPFDCQIQKSHVRLGDFVHKNQLIAVLDGRDIRAQISSLEAKLAQAEQRQSAALATRNASEAELERLEIQYLLGEIDRLERRQAALEIRSPIDGMVIDGDLERVEGATFTMGETLLEIAPVDELIVEVAIPESEISYVEQEMPISIRFDFAPHKAVRARLEEIHPRNEMRNDQSVFVGEASVSNPDNAYRPGMNGKASIQTGMRSVGWILFHKPYQTVRATLGW